MSAAVSSASAPEGEACQESRKGRRRGKRLRIRRRWNAKLRAGGCADPDVATNTATVPLGSGESSHGDGLGLNDSDFDSSDVDAVLMSMGPEQCESAKIANLWAQRQQRKRKLAKKEDSASVVEEEEEEEESSVKRIRAPGGGVCQAAEGVREVLAQGQAEFVAGRYDSAIECMHRVIQSQPELADPYHVLALIYSEQGQAKKSLDAMLLSAYLSSGPDARPIWRQVAAMSQRQGLLDQACYAYKRSLGSLGGQGKRTGTDFQSMWELAQLYFRKANADRGLQVLYLLYKETNEERIACEIARTLVEKHRWRECLELLETCIERGRMATPPRIDLNVLNVFCEVLMEVRDFARCANLLTELFRLGDAAETQSSDTAGGDGVSLSAKLRACPVDLVAKLAASLCRLRGQEDAGADLLRRCSIEVVLSHPPETHHDLYVLLVDSLLADDSATAASINQRWPRRSSVDAPSAEQALQILDLMGGVHVEDDLRERRATCLWRLGKVEQAALLLEELLSSSPGRPEAELQDLRVRIAEAWLERGSLDRADQYLSALTYEDLQRSNTLPPALSAGERRARYQMLNEFLEQASANAQADGSSSSTCTGEHPLFDGRMPGFLAHFRHLIHDCELDYARLSRHTATGSASLATSAAESGGASAEPHDTEQVGSRESPLHQPQAAGSGLAVTCKTEGSSVADGRAEPQHTIVKFKPVKPKQGHDVSALQNPSVFFKMKRRHLGLESIEDIFGFEAYLSFVLRGIDAFRAYAFGEERWIRTDEGLVEVARVVELCEMILTNRRLIALRNPVKRRMMRVLALKSMTLAFEARLWRIVFKHLRGMCDQGANDDLVALFARILFTHADAEFLSGRASKDASHEGVTGEKSTAFSASGHRNTYASSFTDVRSWALRKLLRKPRSFSLTLLCGHFCTIASKYTMSVAEYCRAHRLAPHDALTSLCIGAAYISFAMSRTAVHRHDLVLKGLSFIQRYKWLRLDGLAEPRAGEHLGLHRGGPSTMVDSGPDAALERLVRLAEVSYNLARAYHQLGLYQSAAESYTRALSLFPSADVGSREREEGASPHLRADARALRSSCAYNLAVLYRAQGSLGLASRVLWEHLTF